MSDIQQVTEKPSLAKIIEQEMNAFNNFMVILLMPMPHKDAVRVIMDDGVVKLTLKRDKFLSMIMEVLDIDDPRVRPNYLRIKECLFAYQGFYLYDKVANKFEELTELPNFQRVSPKDLRDSAVEQMKNSVEDDSDYQVLKRMNEELRKKKSPFAKMFAQSLANKFGIVSRNFHERDKEKVKH
jgi:hypothetical protein